MPEDKSDIAPLGFYNFRQQKKKFGIKLDDRRRHVYIIGKTGVGKSTLLENMVISDIRTGKGVAFFDPHGESAEKLLDFIPEERLNDVIYFDPSDLENPIAFNPMEQVGTKFRHLVASGIMGVFKKIWPDAWSARMEYILNNTILALLEYPDSTILGIMRMFSEPAYRKKIVDNLQDPVIKAFWTNEFAKYTQRLETEALAAIQNKVGQFISNPLIRNIMGQPRSTINMRDIMDNGKILIVNLSKGKIGEDNSRLLGAMMISRLQLAAMSRVDIPEEKRNDFFLYVDEFQNFATESFANILSEARKYRLGLVLAHQYISQLVDADNTKVRDAVFGNVGTIISFRIGGADAEFLEKEFMPEFTENDLVNLAKANIYIKLMIDGVASRPFSAETIPPERPPMGSYRDIIIKNTREKYGTPSTIVDAKIASEWEAASGVILDEKIVRRGEQRLHDVLKSDVRIEKQKPQARDDRRITDNKNTQNVQNTPTTSNEQNVQNVQNIPNTPVTKKEYPKSPASIDEMRRAINESLKKQSENDPKIVTGESDRKKEPEKSESDKKENIDQDREKQQNQIPKQTIRVERLAQHAQNNPEDLGNRDLSHAPTPTRSYSDRKENIDQDRDKRPNPILKQTIQIEKQTQHVQNGHNVVGDSDPSHRSTSTKLHSDAPIEKQTVHGQNDHKEVKNENISHVSVSQTHTQASIKKEHSDVSEVVGDPVVSNIPIPIKEQSGSFIEKQRHEENDINETENKNAQNNIDDAHTQVKENYDEKKENDKGDDSKDTEDGNVRHMLTSGKEKLKLSASTEEARRKIDKKSEA